MTIKKNSRFIILTTQRSGSTWLVDMLNKLEGVIVYGELFLRRERKWDSGAVDFPRFFEYDSPSPLFPLFSYLSDLFSKPASIGFKLMYRQMLHPGMLLYLLTHRKLHIIHLIRKNHLDVIISKERMRVTGQAHVIKDKDIPIKKKIALDPAKLLQRIRAERRQINIVRLFLKLLQSKKVEVYYEDLVHSPAAIKELFEFLKIINIDQIPESDLVKISQGTYQEVIENYDEVKQVLEHSEFAEFIK